MPLAFSLKGRAGLVRDSFPVSTKRIAPQVIIITDLLKIRDKIYKDSRAIMKVIEPMIEKLVSDALKGVTIEDERNAIADFVFQALPTELHAAFAFLKEMAREHETLRTG